MGLDSRHTGYTTRVDTTKITNQQKIIYNSVLTISNAFTALPFDTGITENRLRDLLTGMMKPFPTINASGHIFSIILLSTNIIQLATLLTEELAPLPETMFVLLIYVHRVLSVRQVVEDFGKRLTAVRHHLQHVDR